MQNSGLNGILITMDGRMKSDQYTPHKYIAARRDGSRKKEQALRDARTIARYLAERHGCEIYGLGSLFDDALQFSSDSDIDLVVKNIPKGRFFSISAEAAEMTQFSLDIIPYESANKLVRETVKNRGVRL